MIGEQYVERIAHIFNDVVQHSSCLSLDEKTNMDEEQRIIIYNSGVVEYEIHLRPNNSGAVSILKDDESKSIMMRGVSRNIDFNISDTQARYLYYNFDKLFQLANRTEN